MINFLIAFLADRTESDKGATAVEYGLMLALIAAVIVVAITTLGSTLLGIFNDVVGAIS
jgi:pilus assembly protein Flp/PilA